MPNAPAVRYRVDLDARDQHLVTVVMIVPADLAAGGRIVLPVWTPGSYVVRNYVHHLQRIAAATAGRDEIVLTPDGVSAWLLPPDLDADVTVTLELYANELTVRTNHVDGHHALLIPAATFPMIVAGRDRRHEITIAPAPGQRVFSLLPDADADTDTDTDTATGRGDATTVVADDYDHLVDSAFEVGDFPVVDFEVAGVPHRFVWAGHGGAPDLGRIARDTTAVAEVAAELFDGKLPVTRYTLLCVGWSQGGGGLEHRDGAVLMSPVRTFQDEDRYADFQSLVAHEYLHTWNVKRLTPQALVRPDFERPTHSESLWVAEGWTAWYDELLPLRAGLWTIGRYLGRLADLAHRVSESPGASLQSVRASGYQAWVKQYVRDENSTNAGVDYYSHGAVLAWCLDLLIRREDPDGPGLDGAFRRLWDRFGATGEGYTEADVEAAVADVAGRALDDFFATHVARPASPPIHELVAVAGLRFEVTESDRTTATPDLGALINENDDGVTIGAVARERPAWRAGLTGGDRLLAIDGLRVSRGELATALRAHRPGDTVEVVVFRGPRLVTSSVTLGAPRVRPTLTAIEQPSDDQRAAFRNWTGRDLDAI